MKSARSFVVWMLLVAVPVFGVSGTLVELLGVTHVHRAPTLVAAASGDAGDPMSGWVDLRRSMPRVLPYHLHTHSAFERHHHDAGDPTVIALDGAWHDGASGDDGGSGGAAHVLAPLTVVAAITVEVPRHSWARADASPVSWWAVVPLDRPPAS